MNWSTNKKVNIYLRETKPIIWLPRQAAADDGWEQLHGKLYIGAEQLDRWEVCTQQQLCASFVGRVLCAILDTDSRAT